jgi:hypothetical protein
VANGKRARRRPLYLIIIKASSLGGVMRCCKNYCSLYHIRRIASAAIGCCCCCCCGVVSPNDNGNEYPWLPPTRSDCQRCQIEEQQMERSLFQSGINESAASCLTCTCNERHRSSYLSRAISRWRRVAITLTCLALTLFGSYALQGMIPDGIGYVSPCYTRNITVEIGICNDNNEDDDETPSYPCLQAYRTMEWRTTTTDLADPAASTEVVHKSRFVAHRCKWNGRPSRTCNQTLPSLIEYEQSLMMHNISQTCWLDLDTGSLINATDASTADAQRQSESYKLDAILLGCLASLALCSCIIWRRSISLPEMYDDKITSTREHRHQYHTDDYLVVSTFLMGFHHRCGSAPLIAMKADPCYDSNLPHLICQFVDDAIPPIIDGSHDDHSNDGNECEVRLQIDDDHLHVHGNHHLNDNDKDNSHTDDEIELIDSKQVKNHSHQV